MPETEVDLRALAAQLDAALSAAPTEATIALCDGVLEKLPKSDPSSSASTSADARFVAARALFEKARVSAALGRSLESQRTVAELVRRAEHDPEPAIRTYVCRALFGQAKDRLAEGKIDRRALVVDYRHVLHIAERAPSVDALAVEALFHLALTHGKIAVERESSEHREKALERFAEIDRRFGASRSPEIVPWVVRGGLSHALLLDLDAASQVYETLATRYEKDASSELRSYAAETLTRWATRCRDEGKPDQAPELEARAARAAST